MADKKLISIEELMDIFTTHVEDLEESIKRSRTAKSKRQKKTGLEVFSSVKYYLSILNKLDTAEFEELFSKVKDRTEKGVQDEG